MQTSSVRTRKSRFTIEWIRTLVLGAGCLLVVVLIGFLAVGRWRNHLNLKEIPKRLGVDIQQEANGVTYTQAHAGHTLFKIHASKVVQLKEGGKALLHDVQIELYGDDGNRVDRIAGDAFEYDQQDGKAIAAGPVEITLMRPGQAPSVAHEANTGKPAPARQKGTVLSNAAQTAAQGEIHVKTSGLIFDQKSGVASTQQRVEFSLAQGSGSSIGALFDSDHGLLVLDHAVNLDIHRGNATVAMRAQHAEFLRGDLICKMDQAQAAYRGGEASAGHATVLFRPDGSAEKLDAEGGFALRSATDARVAAPQGTIEFNEHSQPQHGRLEGGATLDSERDQQKLHATSPTADLAFTSDGELKHVHLERGVVMHSDGFSADHEHPEILTRLTRDWRSPVADLEFRSVEKGQVELASLHGTGGVVVDGQSQTGNGPVAPSRLAAEDVVGSFGPNQQLTALTGAGKANLQQTTAAGVRQTVSGDRIQASFANAADKEAGSAKETQVNAARSSEARSGAAGPGATGPGAPVPATPPSAAKSDATSQIQAATVLGHVTVTQEPANKSGAPPAPVLHATAGRADYDGQAEWIHLTVNPHVDDGQLQLSSDRVDVSRASGDAFAHGNVKATWLGGAPPPPPGETEKARTPPPPSAQNGMFGGQGPAHVIASEAQLHQATGEATFRGNVRMWEQANSISAPTIVLDRTKQTLVARGDGKAHPVRVVLLSSNGTMIPQPGAPPAAAAGKGQPVPPTEGPAVKSDGPSVIRVRGGDLKYSDAERKAVMLGGSAGAVEADMANGRSQSASVELFLLPLHNHAAADGSAGQVDKVVAAGDVRVDSLGRLGTGTRLVYSSENSQYVLTGTATDPPRMSVPGRGTVTGDSLIFNSHDGSVSIEGEGHKTTTETLAPK